ncbi:MAG: hypothetical protein J5606_02490 [Bacteroidales bacterium]|nr:hypothetical protein [Bacteroidales bacterium]
MYLQTLILSVILSAATPPRVAASWYDTWKDFDIDPLVAEAVVWPEMERYSRLQDVLETAANYGTYITLGTNGFDFSIGRFQMKPSFVEKMEKAWMKNGLARKYALWFDTADNATARKIRITRLQKEEWQVVYVGVFLRLLYLSYGSYNKQGKPIQQGIETLPIKEQIYIAATAYNRGCVWTDPGCGNMEQIHTRVHEKHFHYALLPTKQTSYYCYAALAWKHYKSIAR